jgi:hypothetical protein
VLTQVKVSSKRVNAAQLFFGCFFKPSFMERLCNIYSFGMSCIKLIQQLFYKLVHKLVFHLGPLYLFDYY